MELKLTFVAADMPTPSVSVLDEKATEVGFLYTVTFTVRTMPLWVVMVSVAEPARRPVTLPAASTLTYFVLLDLKLNSAWQPPVISIRSRALKLSFRPSL